MARYFTSDLHFGHENIIRYSGRPFGSVEEMNQQLVARWNATVGADDEVWVLGDVALGKTHETLEFVRALTGRKVLVTGNHDRCWPGHGAKAERWEAIYRDAGFAEIRHGTIRTALDGADVICNHFPYRGDSHDEDRHRGQRPVDAGLPLIHGHVHERWQVNGRQFNVGVDVWDYRPVSEATLATLLRQPPE